MTGSEWLQTLAASQKTLGELLGPDFEARKAAGYGHTLAEICQQPETWLETAQRAVEQREELLEPVEGCAWLMLTGSGSSQYAGECVHPVLQKETQIPARTLGGGCLLIDGPAAAPPGRPGLLISLARSGDSPESAGVVDCFLEDPGIRHLIFTCNVAGRLATRFRANRRVFIFPLPPRTNDRSLVMTSSFTNLAIAARSLGLLREPDRYLRTVEGLARAAREILLRQTDSLAQVARSGFRRVVYLAHGCRFGAARESALKMLEMNAGRVPTMAETFLGLRHGPMCLVDSKTLLVCFLDTEPVARAYEEDLLEETSAKGLGLSKVIVGENIPPRLLGDNGTAIEIPGLGTLGDANAPVLDVLTGQLLAFFRCLAEGLKPDMPSDGVINRVVNKFPLHRATEMK
ncbi:MAG: SIS domain-containing protein [Rhodospirillales bacterium]